MKTVLSGRHGRDGVVKHELDEDETWAQHGLDQPNPVWTHDEAWWPHCPVCSPLMLPAR